MLDYGIIREFLPTLIQDVIHSVMQKALRLL